MKNIANILLIISALIVFTGCKHMGHLLHGHQPGQVKKATGYNPASGKIHSNKSGHVPLGHAKNKNQNNKTY